jgi:hypothetical protein
LVTGVQIPLGTPTAIFSVVNSGKYLNTGEISGVLNPDFGSKEIPFGKINFEHFV